MYWFDPLPSAGGLPGWARSRTRKDTVRVFITPAEPDHVAIETASVQLTSCITAESCLWTQCTSDCIDFNKKERKQDSWYKCEHQHLNHKKLCNTDESRTSSNSEMWKSEVMTGIITSAFWTQIKKKKSSTIMDQKGKSFDTEVLKK